MIIEAKYQDSKRITHLGVHEAFIIMGYRKYYVNMIPTPWYRNALLPGYSWGWDQLLWL